MLFREWQNVLMYSLFKTIILYINIIFLLFYVLVS